MRKRQPRHWIIDAIEVRERWNDPTMLDMYVCHFGHDAHVMTVKLLDRGKVHVLDVRGRVLFRFATVNEYKNSVELALFIMLAPSWWLHGWRSRTHRRSRWAKAKSCGRGNRVNLRNCFNAAHKGPRWNDMARQYCELPNSMVRRGNRSNVKRLRKLMGMNRVVTNE